jgi:hypothetical protein
VPTDVLAHMPLLAAFVGGATGTWSIQSMATALGEGLPSALRLDVVESPAARAPGAAWELRGVTSNERYLTRAELDALRAVQEPLGRPASTRAALIPITKSEAWWELAQDERRRIFEETSHHLAVGLRYLPAIARRLHHGRDLGEPFDFLTWFEYAEGDAAGFEELVALLRATEEWTYVVREVDVRLSRGGAVGS